MLRLSGPYPRIVTIARGLRLKKLSGARAPKTAFGDQRLSGEARVDDPFGLCNDLLAATLL
jgi:hypothetical protein